MTNEQCEMIAQALLAIADSIEKLGMNDADCKMGAMENLAKEVREGFEFLGACVESKGK